MRYVKIITVFLCAAAVVMAFAGCGPAKSQNKTEAAGGGVSLTGTEWLLKEIRAPKTTVLLDRQSMKNSGLGKAYSLTFEEDRVSGEALPNLWTAPCSIGEKNTLIIERAVATRMELPEENRLSLTEDVFFGYLEMIRSWEINSGGDLELCTNPNQNGLQVTLVFTRA